MLNINEFRIVGKIVNIGNIFTYQNNTQVLVVEIQTNINNEIMKHSVNFYDHTAHNLLASAVIGQCISVDGSLMAIEHFVNNQPQTYFGLKALHFFVISDNQHCNIPNNVPPLPHTPKQQTPRPQNQQQQTPRQQTPRQQTPRQQTPRPQNQQQQTPRPQNQQQQTPRPQNQQQQIPKQQDQQQQVKSQPQSDTSWTDEFDWDAMQAISPPKDANVGEFNLSQETSTEKPNNANMNATIAGVKIDTTLPFVVKQ